MPDEPTPIYDALQAEYDEETLRRIEAFWEFM